MCLSFAIFKCMTSLKLGGSDWLSKVLTFISWKNKKNPRSDSGDIVALCLYHYSSVVSVHILTELELFLRLIIIVIIINMVISIKRHCITCIFSAGRH